MGFPAWNYMFKVNNRNIRTRCELCSKMFDAKRHFGVFVVSLEHILHLVLVLLMLT